MPSPEEREEVRQRFAHKNARRKTNDSRKTKEARELRQSCGGAFGAMKGKDFNRLVEGTDGIPRHEAKEAP